VPSKPNPEAAVTESAPEPVAQRSPNDEPITETKPITESDPPPKFRLPDQRPVHDDRQLAAAGIHAYESKRLKLYTDIDAEVAKSLPPLVDQLYDALVDYFGPLPPDPKGADFQMTGYLIRDEALFREHDLMEGLPMLLHGKHHANRLWLRDQEHAYYRRHLLLHECTHCFMTIVPGTTPPVWYMEGMAELFGTHRLRPDGKADFRILPNEADDVGGWGRISAVRRECAEKRPLTLFGVCQLPAEAFVKPEAYAWSWALCHFLDSHPRYARQFRELGRHLIDGEFEGRFREAFGADLRDVSTEWTLFEHQIQPGYDTARAAIEFQTPHPLDRQQVRTVIVKAARGWQDVGVQVAAGDVVEFSATGEFRLAQEPKPWISEPQGISFRYFNGIPLGRLVACLDADPIADTEASPGMHLLHVVPIGKSARLTIPANGRLLLRLNDAWDALADNEGTVEVTIRRGTVSPP
jgi:hypothetical protein